MVLGVDIRVVQGLRRLGRGRGGLVVADEVLFGLFEQCMFGVGDGECDAGVDHGVAYLDDLAGQFAEQKSEERK